MLHSNPQVIVVSAEDEKKATELLNKQLATENYPPGNFGKLTELDTTKPNLIILTPPGDRHFER